MGEETGHPIFTGATTVALNADAAENESIAKADIFGEHLFDESHTNLVDPFDPTSENPFAGYLRKLAIDLDRLGVVKVGSGELRYGTPWLRFPDYDLCGEELSDTANGSPDARRTLETGYARLSDIPAELDGDERAAWLEDRLPAVYKDLEEGQPMAAFASFEATSTPEQLDEFTAKLEDELASRRQSLPEGGRNEN